VYEDKLMHMNYICYIEKFYSVMHSVCREIFAIILGLLKFCTFGFMLIWTLIDILLIALQVCEHIGLHFGLFTCNTI